MGNCVCRSVSALETDPTVTSYSEVGETVILHKRKCSTFPGGLLYTQDNSLLFKPQTGCFCCVRRYKLSKVGRIEVIEDEVMKYLSSSEIKLSPGLRIGVHPDITILVSTPDAVEFGQKLQSASN